MVEVAGIARTGDRVATEISDVAVAEPKGIKVNSGRINKTLHCSQGLT